MNRFALYIALGLLVITAGAGNATTKRSPPDAHHKRSNALEERRLPPEPTVPINLYNTAQAELLDALSALRSEQEARTKEQHAGREPIFARYAVLIQAVLAGVGFGYLVFASLQWRVLWWAFLADHRPNLGILNIALLTVPDDILVPDAQGRLKQEKGIEVQLRLINRGGSDAKITEGNVTFSVDKLDGMESVLREEKLLPPFDIRKGAPEYSDERDVAIGSIVKPAEPYSLNARMPLSGSAYEAAHIYLAVHPRRNISSVAFHVFGYFKYRNPSWFRPNRSYVTAFCRRYDPSKGGGFVVTNEPDYEYQY